MTVIAKKAFKFIKKTQENDKVTFYLCFTYFAVISLYMLYHRMWLSPDQFFFVAAVAAILMGGFFRFLKDWLPFLLLFFSYEYLRGLVPLVIKRVNITPMIDADQFMFGFIPTIKLQEWLFKPGNPQWYDFLASFLYMTHFIVPFVIAFLFWRISRTAFREFSIGLLILSFAGFITYIIYPAMPPWMASQQGYLPPLEKVTDATINAYADPMLLPTIYGMFRGNPVAAMPSLHAAFPLLVTLFVFRRSRLIGTAMIPYVLGVWFSVTYLGEHYVIDVIAGAIYAAAVFALIVKRDWVFAKLSQINPFPYIKGRIAKART